MVEYLCSNPIIPVLGAMMATMSFVSCDAELGTRPGNLRAGEPDSALIPRLPPPFPRPAWTCFEYAWEWG